MQDAGDRKIIKLIYNYLELQGIFFCRGLVNGVKKPKVVQTGAQLCKPVHTI